jgi:hypothetical protein
LLELDGGVILINFQADDQKIRLEQNGSPVVRGSNGRVSDKPRRLPRHQRAQAHNSTLYPHQHSFMNWLCSKQNCLLCAYECDFDDNDIITIVEAGLITKKMYQFCQY